MLYRFLRLSPLQAVIHPSADPARCCWTSSSAVSFTGDHPSHCRPSPVRPGLFLRMSSGCFTVFLDCLLFRPSPIHVPIRPGAAGVHLQLSRFQRSPIPLLTEPGAAWPFSSIVFSSGGQPSECRPFLVLLDFIFSYPVSSTDNRARCCLTFSFDCLLFRRSPIRVPSWPGAAGLHLRLSRFPVVTHPTADRSWCCLTFFFYCLLYRWSPIWVPTFPGASVLHVRPSRFRWSPIPLPTEPGVA